jgi:hypothetical protein
MATASMPNSSQLVSFMNAISVHAVIFRDDSSLDQSHNHGTDAEGLRFPFSVSTIARR